MHPNADARLALPPSSSHRYDAIVIGAGMAGLTAAAFLAQAGVESYLLTSERLRITRGIVGKDREDIELVRIEDIDHKQNLGERVLNLGDVIVRSHDPSTPEVVLRNVTNPMEVHEAIRRAMLDARKRHRYSIQEEM